MMRMGGASALDLDNYYPKEQYLEINHRPKSGTQIKNKSQGERLVAISTQIRELLDDRIANKRPDGTDDYDRKPLVTSTRGRVAKSTIRTYVYRWTRPFFPRRALSREPKSR